MRKAAIGLGILVVLVLAGLILAPRFIDLDRFKGPIAAQLSERTGLPVELAGPIGLTLLPSPALTAREVRVANPPGAAVRDMVRLRALEVKLAPLPLLAGRIELRSAMLIDPEIDVERLPDGAPNWRFAARPVAATAAGGGAAPPPAVAVGALDRLVLQNGAVTWRVGGGIERFEHINATASLDEASGGIGAKGDLVARGAALSFDLHSGMPGAAEVPLQLSVTTRPTARLQLDAVLSGPGDDRRVAGTLKLTGEDARAILATLARAAVPSALAQPLAVSADLSGSMRRLALDHLAVDLGPAHAEGSLHVEAGTPPAIALRLSIPQLDLDRWPVPRQAAFEPAQPLLAGLFAAAPIPARRAASEAALPAGIDASLELGVEAVLWRGGLIREARLKLSLARGRLTLDRLAALLPGGSDASLSGSAAPTAAGLGADGTVAINSDDLRSLVGWFGASVASVPADRLRKATLSSRLALAGDRLDLTDIEATLDATRLSGAATVLLRARPGIGLRFAADRFNLDAYLPPRRAAAPPAAGVSLRDALSLLAGFDANVDGSLQGLTWRGQPMSEVSFSATLQDGEATIHKFSVGDLGGASANLSGVVDELGGAPTGQLAFDMRGPELERVLRVASPALATGRSYGAFSLGGGMQYDKDTITIDTDLHVLDGYLHVVGDIARPSGTLDLGFELDHPSFAALVRNFRPLYQPPADPGAVKLTGRLAGDRHRFSLEQLALAIGQGTLSGTLGVDLSGARPQLDADLSAGDWTIDRLLSERQAAAIDRRLDEAAPRPGILLAEARTPRPAKPDPWSEAPIDLGLLRRADLALKLAAHSLAYDGWRLDAPKVAAAVKDGVLTLQQLDGRLFGGSLAASGTLDATAAPTVQARVALKDADFKAALGTGLLDGHFDLEASLASAGASEAELVARASGDAALESRGGSVAGVDLKAVDEALQSHSRDLLALLRGGAGGRTEFSSLAGHFRLAGGVASSDDLRLVAAGGQGSATLRLDLPKWTMASRVELALSGAPDAPPLVMRLDGPIDAPRTIFEVNALEQYLARHAPAEKAARP